MNRQQIFDTGVVGIIQQGGPSIDDGGSCLYRGPDNRACALGHSIPDNLYRRSFEHMTPIEVGGAFAVECGIKLGQVLGVKDKDDVSFLLDFQTCHDSPAREAPKHFIQEFVENARRFARQYKLNTSALDKALAAK